MSKSLRKMLVGVSAAACATFIGSSAFAAPIAVANFSFETPPPGGLPNACGVGCSYSIDAIPGWSNGGFSGQFQPGSSSGNFTYFDSVPDGLTVAYSNGGTISQITGATVALGVVYTLQVDQGVRHDLGDLGTIDLLINGTQYFATGVAAAPGGWSTYTATYIGLPGDVGSSIAIELNNSLGGQGDWDNVRLDARGRVAGVPEPLTLALFGAGLAGMAGMRRRKKAA